MTATRGLDERFVVPRWRSFAMTLSVGELATPREEGEAAGTHPREHDLDLDLFDSDPGLYLASDLLGRVILGSADAVEALPVSDYVLRNSRSTKEQRRLATAAQALAAGDPVPLDPSLDPEPVTNAGVIVQLMRTSLRENPRNPVRWMDLALAQTNTGKLEKARRSVQTALDLAPANRFILRSASRFFLHIGDPERAQSLVFPIAQHMHDPWLLAAEIAASDVLGSSSRLIVRARQRMRTGSYAPDQVSEMACAIACREFEAGQDKPAKKLLARALEWPTENAVAQAEFEARRGMFNLPEEILSREGAFEARAVDFGSRSQWHEAVRYAKKWQQDQSFASDPAMYLSYVASVCLEDYQSAADAAQVGLTANPGSAMLANNRAFALVNIDKVGEAATLLDRYPLSTFDDSDRAVQTATRGLIAFRQGDSAQGRDLYREAFSVAAGAGRLDQAAFAAAYWAREEVRLGSPMVDAVLEIARRAAAKSESGDPALVLARVEESASALTMLGGASGQATELLP